MIRLLNNKGQNVIEYLLIIAVLALGIIVGGRYMRNIISCKTDSSQYGARVKTSSGGYYTVNDRKNAVTTYTEGTGVFGTEVKGTWKP